MVNKQLLMPQEIETFYIIPTLRRHIAQFLKESGMSQTKIAELMQINKSAVSQYLNDKRGNKIILNKKVINKIKQLIPKIKTQIDYMRSVQEILFFIRKNKFICEIHRQFSQIPLKCNPKDTGCLNSMEDLVYGKHKN